MKLGISVAEYVERFDKILPTTSKTFVFVLIPIIAVGAWLFFFKKIRAYIPHLIFTTTCFHFFWYLLLFSSSFLFSRWNIRN